MYLILASFKIFLVASIRSSLHDIPRLNKTDHFTNASVLLKTQVLSIPPPPCPNHPQGASFGALHYLFTVVRWWLDDHTDGIRNHHFLMLIFFMGKGSPEPISLHTSQQVENSIMCSGLHQPLARRITLP